ncbi:hypothetical protein cyc_03622 [Cyclospora cayetanensis]|uniref:Uncharacterized protein n=1 Tax=Cyclospora cayetanensis TaxID=88456 RepID=A0A1D3D9Q0_9EIME|nr:hypothetical protein cyc_03622 [Cyclospora cayetanensis]
MGRHASFSLFVLLLFACAHHRCCGLVRQQPRLLTQFQPPDTASSTLPPLQATLRSRTSSSHNQDSLSSSSVLRKNPPWQLQQQGQQGQQQKCPKEGRLAAGTPDATRAATAAGAGATAASEETTLLSSFFGSRKASTSVQCEPPLLQEAAGRETKGASKRKPRARTGLHGEAIRDLLQKQQQNPEQHIQGPRKIECAECGAQLFVAKGRENRFLTRETCCAGCGSLKFLLKP